VIETALNIIRSMIRRCPRMLLYGLGLPLLLQGVVACTSPADSSAPSPKVVAAPVNAVVALGRLVPDGEVIKVSVSNAQDSRLNQIFVKEGDRYQLMRVGWNGLKRMYHSVMHFDIKAGQVWIQQNMTDVDVAEELVEMGF
jgi:hypothetical protein